MALVLRPRWILVPNGTVQAETPRGTHDRNHWQEAGYDPGVQRSGAADPRHGRGGDAQPCREGDGQGRGGLRGRGARVWAAADGARVEEGRGEAARTSCEPRRDRPREEGGPRLCAARSSFVPSGRRPWEEPGDPDLQRR